MAGGWAARLSCLLASPITETSSAMDDLDEGLACSGTWLLLAHGTFLDARHEIAHHWQGDVRLEQRHADFCRYPLINSSVRRPVGLLTLVQGARESFSQILKHDAFRFWRDTGALVPGQHSIDTRCLRRYATERVASTNGGRAFQQRRRRLFAAR